jgi:hypothetical protein
LRPFARHLNSHLEDQNLEYGIHLIEQVDDNHFNRGMLLNVGYELTKEEADYFVFHDVDEMPLEGVDYGYPVTPVLQLSSELSRFNWGVPYGSNCGGVVMFTKEGFEQVRGFSNEYWGWGGEDDDMSRRLHHFQLLPPDVGVPRPSKGKGKFLSIVEAHTERIKENPLDLYYSKWSDEGKKRTYTDGLELFKKMKIFSEVERETNRWYIRHKVKLDRVAVDKAVVDSLKELTLTVPPSDWHQFLLQISQQPTITQIQTIDQTEVSASSTADM